MNYQKLHCYTFTSKNESKTKNIARPHHQHIEKTKNWRTIDWNCSISCLKTELWNENLKRGREKGYLGHKEREQVTWIRSRGKEKQSREYIDVTVQRSQPLLFASRFATYALRCVISPDFEEVFFFSFFLICPCVIL